MKITDEQKTDPVTTIVQHEILKGSEAAFESWSERIRAACRKFPGYMGTEVIKPVADSNNTYVCIFRFDHFTNLEGWMASADRLALIEESAAFNASKPEYGQYQSLEYLFDTPSTNTKPPSREKMAFVTYLGLVPPVYFVPPLITEYVSADPLIGTLASLGVITPMMVYAIMPILTKVAARWLFK